MASQGYIIEWTFEGLRFSYSEMHARIQLTYMTCNVLGDVPECYGPPPQAPSPPWPFGSFLPHIFAIYQVRALGNRSAEPPSPLIHTPL